MTSFGASLRRERELRGVSLQEIAASTKISVSLLQAIEDDRLDKLPQGLFVRGFVREYARFLALDEQKILTELSFHATEAPTPEFLTRSSDRRGVGLSARVVHGAMVVGFAGLVAALILSPGFGRSTSGVAESTSVTSLPAPAQTTEPEPLTATPVRVATTSPVSPEPTPASVLPQPLQLTLTATEDCWIGLDVGGDRVENRVLKKGESFSITARQNASLAVGNAGGLLVAIDSGPPRPLGNRGEVKRNIPLSPEGIGALSVGAQAPPTKPIG